MYKEGSTVSNKDITDEINTIYKCLTINPAKDDLKTMFANELIAHLWFGTYRNSKQIRDFLKDFEYNQG